MKTNKHAGGLHLGFDSGEGKTTPEGQRSFILRPGVIPIIQVPKDLKGGGEGDNHLLEEESLLTSIKNKHWLMKHHNSIIRSKQMLLLINNHM